jgi:hypothetical protein
LPTVLEAILSTSRAEFGDNRGQPSIGSLDAEVLN